MLRDVNLRSEFASDLRIFSATRVFASRWYAAAHAVMSARVRLRRRFLLMAGGLGVLSAALLAVPLAYTVGQAVAYGQSSDLITVLTSVMLLRTGMWVLFANGKDFVEALSGVRRFAAFIQEDIRDTNIANGLTAPELAPGGLCLDHVSFAYPSGRQVFSDLSLHLRPGESLAIVGLNGAGKTSLTRLVTRLLSHDNGTVTWNGVPISDIDVDSLRGRMAIVPQEFSHLPVSLRDNLSMGASDMDDAKLMSALRRVGLDELATTESLDSPLTRSLESGIELSGGQWQRLAIARALLRPGAELFLWDEPTSALDPAVENEIVRLLLEVSEGRTTVVITHRLGVCTQVDRVAVLDGGEVVQLGSHHELMGVDGLYRTWFASQAAFYRESDCSRGE